MSMSLKDSVEPEANWIPSQSPAAGDPDPVDPPTLLSLIDVNVIGDPDVPTASNEPSTASPTPASLAYGDWTSVPLMTAPAAIVSAIPLGTVKPSAAWHCPASSPPLQPP